MKEKIASMTNKKHGIMFMVSAIFITILMLLSNHWPSGYSFIENISAGYVFYIRMFECETYEIYSCSTYFHFYFRYVVIIPMVIFMFGLFGYLNDKKNINKLDDA